MYRYWCPTKTHASCIYNKTWKWHESYSYSNVHVVVFIWLLYGSIKRALKQTIDLSYRSILTVSVHMKWSQSCGNHVGCIEINTQEVSFLSVKVLQVHFRSVIKVLKLTEITRVHQVDLGSTITSCVPIPYYILSVYRMYYTLFVISFLVSAQ